MSLDPGEFELLERSLHALAASAALIDAGSAPALAALADSTATWLRQAEHEAGGFSEILPLAERVAEGLRRGFDPAQGMERLEQCIERAFKRMEALQGKEPPAPLKAAPAPAEPAQDGSFTMSVGAEDRDGWLDFIVEVPELLQGIEAQLVGALRDEPFDALAILRPLHTLKGICGMLGLKGFNALMHACEDSLAPYRQSTRLSKGVAEAVLAAADTLRRQSDAIAAGLDQGGFQVADCAAALAELQRAEGGTDPEGAGPVHAEAAEAMEPALSGQRSVDNVIRIPVAKMDSLLEAVSELAICQAQVSGGVLAMGLNSNLSAEAARLEKISRQLQQVVLGLRMVPVAPLFNRISRQAYDLSRRMGKQLKVELEGGETEMDKGLVEELFEPLLHLVRNALDHGLELPEQRVHAGKPAEGRLRLAAYHQGGDFVLEMADDGRGFDLARIADKARSLGRLRADEEAGEAWLLDQIFESGFSTAQALTDLSGRGVGLDAVRRKVQDLKGSVQVSHTPGAGAKFTLRLPLTMALMEAILVRAHGERFALPAANVRRFLAWDPAKRHTVGQGEAWMESEGHSLPLVDLGALAGARAVAMHITAGGREACVVVDEVIGKQQVVVKGLGGLLKDLPGVAGGAVLSDGRVGMILDLESLLARGAHL